MFGKKAKLGPLKRFFIFLAIASAIILVLALLCWGRIAIVVAERWFGRHFEGTIHIGELERDDGGYVIQDVIVYDANYDKVAELKDIRTKVDFDNGDITLKETVVNGGVVKVISHNNHLTVEQAFRQRKSIDLPSVMMEEIKVSDVELIMQLEDTIFRVPKLSAALSGSVDKDGYMHAKIKYAKGKLAPPIPDKSFGFEFFGELNGKGNDLLNLNGAVEIINRSLEMNMRYITGREPPIVLRPKPDKPLEDLISSLLNFFAERAVPDIEVKQEEPKEKGFFEKSSFYVPADQGFRRMRFS